MTSSTHSDAHLLRVARPSECNTQQTAEIVTFAATAPATALQHGGLKALALLALARNTARNSDATNPQNSRNKLGSDNPHLLHEIPTPNDLRALLHRIAADAGIDPANVHELRAEDVGECGGLSEATLCDWLRLRASCPICRANLDPKASP